MIRTPDGTPRGYDLDDFADAFARYVLPITPLLELQHRHKRRNPPFLSPFHPQQPKTMLRMKTTAKPQTAALVAVWRMRTPLRPKHELSATDEGASEIAAKAKTLESILKRFRRLALDVRESPDEGDTTGIGGWPDDINRLADAIADFAEEYRDADSIHAIVNAVLITPKLGIGGERGTAAHRYLWDRALHRRRARGPQAAVPGKAGFRRRRAITMNRAPPRHQKETSR